MLFSISCTEGFFDYQYLQIEFVNLLGFLRSKSHQRNKLPLAGSDKPLSPTPKFPETASISG